MTATSCQRSANFGQNRIRLQQLCDDFNAAHPVGEAVWIRLDNGRQFLTETRARAEVLEGHSAVIWLKGLRGCYLLERVSVKPPVELLP
jgi:hypothetical protein